MITVSSLVLAKKSQFETKHVVGESKGSQISSQHACYIRPPGMEAISLAGTVWRIENDDCYCYTE